MSTRQGTALSPLTGAAPQNFFKKKHNFKPTNRCDRPFFSQRAADLRTVPMSTPTLPELMNAIDAHLQASALFPLLSPPVSSPFSGVCPLLCLISLFPHHRCPSQESNAEYSCHPVSWDDVARATVGGKPSCWGSNITGSPSPRLHPTLRSPLIRNGAQIPASGRRRGSSCTRCAPTTGTRSSGRCALPNPLCPTWHIRGR